MFTRGRSLRRVHLPAPVPHVPYTTRGRVVGSGPVRFIPPVPVIEMDPSDQKTWTRPVRWTT